MKKYLIVGGAVVLAILISYIAYRPILQRNQVAAFAASSMQAAVNNQYDAVWDHSHPDDQAYWGDKESYIDDLKEREEYLSRVQSISDYKIGEPIRLLDQWTSPVTETIYREVYEVPVQMTMLSDGKENIARALWHYQIVDGEPRRFTSLTKDELRETLTELRKLYK